MALSRKYLQGMGLTEEQVNAIIEANEETITGLKNEIETAQADAETNKKKLDKVQKELDGIKEETEGKNPYKVKYEAIKEEFESYKSDLAAKEAKEKKAEAFKGLLKESGVTEKRIASILKVSDVDSIEFDEDGKVKDASDRIKAIKEEWADFIPVDSAQGAKTVTPPASTGKAITKEEIRNIKDATQRQKAMAENPDLFGL